MKLDVAESERIALAACESLKEALKTVPGKRGSAERAEGCLNASIMLLIGSAMGRHGMSQPSTVPDIAGSLRRRILDALEDWEDQHVKR